MAINIKEVARLAGVSHMTVSRVINNSENVTPEMRERVNKVIAETGYVPSLAARTLNSGKSSTIGILVMYDMVQFPSDFLPPILEGISGVLVQNEFSMGLFFDQLNGKKNIAPYQLLTASQLDGLIIIGAESEAEIYERLKEINLPTVVINQKIEKTGVGYVIVDDCEGAYIATKHLISGGHRRIALLSGNEKFSTSRDRKKGYKKALKDAGISFDKEIVVSGEFNSDIAYQEIKKLFKNKNDITAIFSANDVMAMGAYHALLEMKLSIPEDVSVIGYDNQDFCEFVKPELSTISKKRKLMGEEAAKIIIDTIVNNKPIKSKILMPKIIIRNSTK